MDSTSFDHRLGLFAARGGLYDEFRQLDLPIVEFGFRYRRAPITMQNMIAYLRRERIEVLHAHLHLASVFGRVCARAAGVPVRIYTEHSEVRRRSWGWRLLERALVGTTSLKIAVSNLQRSDSIDLEGFPPSKVLTIPNSVVVEDFRHPPEMRRDVRSELGMSDGEVVIGNVSKLHGQKRLDRLIDAVAVLVSEGLPVRLLIVGDGPDRAALSQRAESAGIGDSVEFLGLRRDVPRLLQAMDVYAITSRWEGMPINLLEAMASGLPVAASSVGAIPDVLENGVSGLLHEQGDVDSCVRDLRDLARSPERRLSMGREALRIAMGRLDAQVNARALEAKYVELLEAAP